MSKTSPKSKPVPPTPPIEEDDTEGHWHKWTLEDDGKGGQRLRQSWTPNEPRQAQPSQTGAAAPRKDDRKR